jgi:hypothetical protein
MSIPAVSSVADLLDEEHVGEPTNGLVEAMSPSGPIPSRPKSSLQFGKGFQKKRGIKTPQIMACVAGGIVALCIVLVAAILMNGSGDKPAASLPVQHTIQPSASVTPPPIKSLPGQATPEETFKTFKDAWIAKDWLRVYAIMTPESQNRMTAVLGVVGAMFGPMSPEMSTVMNKHGVDSTALVKLSISATDPFSDGSAEETDANKIFTAAMSVTDSLQDKKGFFVEALPVFLNFLHSKEFADISRMGSQVTGVSIADAFDMLPMLSEKTTLTDLKIDDQTATAVLKTPAGTQGAATEDKVSPLRFQQISGSWYIGAGL